MGEPYAALLVEGMLQQIKKLKEELDQKDGWIRELENRIDSAKKYNELEYRAALEFEEECERRKIGCFDCRYFQREITTPGIYKCKISVGGMDIRMAFSGCSEWEENK